MVYAKRAKFVYAYEPQRVLYRLLLLNCLDNDVYNVVPTCAAISYQSGQAHLSTRITDGLNTDQPVSYNDGVPRNYGESSSEPMARAFHSWPCRLSRMSHYSRSTSRALNPAFSTVRVI